MQDGREADLGTLDSLTVTGEPTYGLDLVSLRHVVDPACFAFAVGGRSCF